MTIAQQLKVTTFPFIIKDKDGKEIYFEDSSSRWIKKEYENGKEIRYEDSTGYWSKRERDANGNTIYFENSDGTIIGSERDEVREQCDRLAEEIKKLKSQLTRTQGAVTISRNGYVQELENELAAVTAQRDRLAEALQMITTFDYRDLQCDNGHGCRSVAIEALQSLTPNEL
jgi:hypothetical protein